MTRFDPETVARARRADLAAYFTSRGYDVKAFRSRRGMQYKILDHGGLFVRDNMFYQFSTGLSGNAIECLMDVLGYSFTDAVRELIAVPTVENLSEEEEGVAWTFDGVTMPDRASDVKRIYAYLIRKRGLDPEILSLLIRHKLLYQDVRGNAVFVHYDGDRMVGGEVQGTTDHRFKGIVPGTKGSAFEILKGNPKEVYLFESAIDMLSYIQMHRHNLDENHVLYASMAGLKKQLVRKYLKQGLKVRSMVDHDYAGVVFNKSMAIELYDDQAEVFIDKEQPFVYAVCDGFVVFPSSEDKNYFYDQIKEKYELERSIILPDSDQFIVDTRLASSGCKDWNELLLENR